MRRGMSGAGNRASARSDGSQWRLQTVFGHRVRVVPLIATLFVGVAHAEIVFGPNQYNRTSGKPDIYDDTFSGPPSPEPGWIIQVLNGNADGTERISSGKLLIDGVDLGPNLFNQQVFEVRRDISTLIQAVNDVHIELGGGPGGHIRVTVASATSGNIVICPVLKVNPGPNGQAQDVKLVWSGGLGSYDVYRSEDPQFRFSSATLIKSTIGTADTACSGPGVSFVDKAAASTQPKLYFYKVSDGSIEDPPPGPCSQGGCPVVPFITSLVLDYGFDGDTIDINGGNFDAVEPKSNLVAFPGGNFAEVISVSSSGDLLKVKVPTNARTGDVTVTVQGLTSNPVVFKVTVPSPGVTFQDISSMFFIDTPERVYVADRGTNNRIYKMDMTTTPPAVTATPATAGQIIMSNGRDAAGSLFYAQMSELCTSTGRISRLASDDTTIVVNWQTPGCTNCLSPSCAVPPNPVRPVWHKALTIRPGETDFVYAAVAHNGCASLCTGCTGCTVDTTDTIWRISPNPYNRNYGSTSFDFPVGAALPPSGLVFDSSGNLYATNATEIKKIVNATTTTVLATGFDALRGLALLDHPNAVRFLLAADAGIGPNNGKVWIVDPVTGSKEVVASGLNNPRAVTFAREPAGEVYFLVAEANRILKFGDPTFEVDTALLKAPRVLVTNKEGVQSGTGWPPLQTALSTLKVAFRVRPPGARQVFLRLRSPDPKDSAPYAVTGDGDNKTPDSTALNVTTVTTDANGNPVSDVLLNVGTDKAGNNYIVEFGWDSAFTKGPATSTKPITVWKRYFYEPDIMYRVQRNLQQLCPPYVPSCRDVASTDYWLPVGDTTQFSNGDIVLIWDRKSPVTGHISERTVDVFDTQTLFVTSSGGTVGYDFPQADGDGDLYPVVTRIAGGTYGDPDVSRIAPLMAESFTEMVPSSTNAHPFVPFVPFTSPPPSGTEEQYITARWGQFFDHGFPPGAINDERDDYVQLINAGEQASGPGGQWNGLTSGNQDAPGWSVIFNEEINIKGPGCPSPPCLTLAEVAAFKRYVVLHELIHQFAVNPSLPSCHDAENAWCNPGSCPSEECLMSAIASDNEKANDINHLHRYLNQQGDVFEVRDHALSLRTGEVSGCP